MTSAARRLLVSYERSIRARPLLKWAGGKTSSLELLLKHAPKRIKTYYEPMVGGGALFFALAAEKRFDKAILSDINDDLVKTYKVVQEHPTLLIRGLAKMKNTEAEFLKIRATKPKTWLARAIRFIYLNKTAFNGMYRENQKGEFNVPFGHYENPTICDEDNIRLCSEALRGVSIQSLDYGSVMMLKPGKRDLVYFDPPYIPVSKTSNFTGFVPGGWDLVDHERLANQFTSLAKRGVPVMLSNSDTKLSRKLYKGFDIVKTKVRRAISCKGDGRDPVGEILVLANC